METETIEQLSEEKRPNQLVSWLTFIGLLLLVFHLFSLWYRWLRPDPDFLEFTSSVIEILAIASFLGLQTEMGRKIALQVDSTSLFKFVFKTPARLCLTTWIAVLVVTLLVYAGSPLGAEAYRNKGVAALESGEYSTAIKLFRQAISLEPENARSHYNLAVAYESLYEYDSAILEYQISMEYDDAFWPTYNNLGRLLMVSRKDPQAAISILINGHRKADNPLGKAVIYKNLARAYLESGLPLTALDVLDETIIDLRTLRQEGQSTEIYLAECYLLEARIYTSLGDDDTAYQRWQDSLGYALSVVESLDCTANQESLPQFCIDAIQIRDEARENITE